MAGNKLAHGKIKERLKQAELFDWLRGHRSEKEQQSVLDEIRNTQLANVFVRHSKHKSIRLELLESIDNDSILGAVLLLDPEPEVRMRAAGRIGASPLLHYAALCDADRHVGAKCLTRTADPDILRLVEGNVTSQNRHIADFCLGWLWPGRRFDTWEASPEQFTELYLDDLAGLFQIFQRKDEVNKFEAIRHFRSSAALGAVACTAPTSASRMEAMSAINDADVLGLALASDPDPLVRRAAMQKESIIARSPLFFDAAQHDEDSKVRTACIEILTVVDVLEKVAQKDPCEKNRERARQRIYEGLDKLLVREQADLHTVLQTYGDTQPEEVKRKSLPRDDMFMSIAVDPNEKSHRRLAAFNAIKDPDKALEVALSPNGSYVTLSHFDQGMINEVAMRSKNTFTRRAATEKVADEVLLVRIIENHPDDIVKMAAVMRLKSPALRQHFILNGKHDLLRAANLGLESDVDTLLKVVTSDESISNRKEAVDRLVYVTRGRESFEEVTQEQWFSIAMAFKDFRESSIAAVERIYDTDYLARLTAESKDGQVVELATYKLGGGLATTENNAQRNGIERKQASTKPGTAASSQPVGVVSTGRKSKYILSRLVEETISGLFCYEYRPARPYATPSLDANLKPFHAGSDGQGAPSAPMRSLQYTIAVADIKCVSDVVSMLDPVHFLDNLSVTCPLLVLFDEEEPNEELRVAFHEALQAISGTTDLILPVANLDSRQDESVLAIQTLLVALNRKDGRVSDTCRRTLCDLGPVADYVVDEYTSQQYGISKEKPPNVGYFCWRPIVIYIIVKRPKGQFCFMYQGRGQTGPSISMRTALREYIPTSRVTKYLPGMGSTPTSQVIRSGWC